MNNLLESLTKEEKMRLKIVHVNKGAILFSEGDICEYVGLVFRGELKIVSYLEDGKEIIYNIIGEKMMFGNNLIFSSNPVYKGDVVANKETYLYLIPKEKLISLLQTNEQFLVAYLETQSNFGMGLNMNIKLLTLNNAKDRVLYILKTNNDKLEYKSITDLAKRMFLTREVLSRSMHELERNGVISIKDKTIIKN